MKSMQENFTKIPNQIIEKLVVEKLNGTQFRILLVLLRYTKGFHRE